MGKNFHQFYFGDALMDPCITESRRQSRCYAVLLFRNCQLTMTFNASVTVLNNVAFSRYSNAAQETWSVL